MASSPLPWALCTAQSPRRCGGSRAALSSLCLCLLISTCLHDFTDEAVRHHLTLSLRVADPRAEGRYGVAGLIAALGVVRAAQR